MHHVAESNGALRPVMVMSVVHFSVKIKFGLPLAGPWYYCPALLNPLMSNHSCLTLDAESS